MLPWKTLRKDVFQGSPQLLMALLLVLPHGTVTPVFTQHSLCMCPCFSIYLSFFKVFYIGVKLINNAVLVSGVQQSDSVMYISIHISIRYQILFPFRLLLIHTTEQHSLCYTVGPYWVSILMQQCIHVSPKFPNNPFPPPFPPVTTSSFSVSLFCK